MKNITINFKDGTVKTEDETIKINNGSETFLMSNPEGFSIVGDAWLRAGWDAKYVYSFTYLGRPIIQQPEDIVRIQELIWKIKPDLIIETGIAHGGSLICYASMIALMDYCEGYSLDNPSGREIIGIDIEIRPHNRKAIEEHPLSHKVKMIEGSSINCNVIKQVEEIVNYHKESYKNNSKVIIFLDSNHTYEHVLRELELYSKFVSVNSYIIACDGYIKELIGKDNAPRSERDWEYNNPKQATLNFVKNNTNFIIEEPEFQFNEGSVNRWTSYFSGGFIKRIK